MIKNLFIIDGASGTGKSDMINYIHRQETNSQYVTVLSKYTTRELRPEEEVSDYHLDLEFISNEQFQDFKKSKGFYSYSYGDKDKIQHYGIFKSKIEEALTYFKNVFIIIRNKNLTEKLRKIFPDVRLVNVFIYTDIPEVIKRLKASNYNQEQIDFRITRQTFAWQDYLKHSQDYEDVIINNSNVTDYERLIDQLLAKYNSRQKDYLEIGNLYRYELTKPIVGFKDEIRRRLKTYSFHQNVFLMMKFRPDNHLLFEFIRDTLTENGFNCVRADQVEWNITNNVYNPIAALYCCKYGIALFDKPEEKNEYSPNVAYELGIMHLQKKECLILKSNLLSPVPFDLIKDLHKVYSNEFEIKNIIKQWVLMIKAENKE